MNRKRTVLFAALLLLLGSMAASADEIDDYIEAVMEERQIPGLAFAVVKNGEVIKATGYGLASVELGVSVTPDSVFQLASITKQFTATAIMLLVEEGKVALDEKINRYIPNAPDTWKDITVRHLLTHTAGLKNFYAPKCQGSWLVHYTSEIKFKAASELPLDFAPGERWQYTDLGYFLLGLIIEQVSGKRYRDFLSERIFQPLGMTSTTVRDPREIIKNHVSRYYLRKGKLARRPGLQDELPAGHGVMSTVKDLAKWDAALYGEQILKQSSLQQMWTPVKFNSGFGHRYGFGWFFDEIRGHRTIQHGGITGTFILRLPDDKLTVIVLTNLELASGSRPWEIARGVAGRYLPGIAFSSLKVQPDPDPQRAQKTKKLLSDIANGVTDSPLMTPELNADSEFIATVLKDMKSFTFMACDDLEELGLTFFDERVRRVCYYKLVNPRETRYFSFYLTADGKVAHIESSTE